MRSHAEKAVCIFSAIAKSAFESAPGDEQPLPVVRRERIETAAVVARVAPSFLRFGHFEHFAARDQVDALRSLADHAIEHHLPEARERAQNWQGNVYAGLLDEVQRRTATLLAQWQAVGFCHGVMNTDNMSLLGLTLDYGPFQFMDGFDPAHICNHSDHMGRYAFGRQPQVAYWNLYRLGQALLPLIGDEDQTTEVLEVYRSVFPIALGDALRAKLGLAGEAAPEALREGDWALVQTLLELLAAERVDHTIFWRRLSQAMAQENGTWDLAAPHWRAVQDLLLDPRALHDWLGRYRQRCEGRVAAELGARMLRTNPHYVLRNHLAEQAIRRAREGDFAETQRLLTVVRNLRDRGVDIPGNPDRNQGPTVDLSHLSPAQQRAYILADNRIAEQAGVSVRSVFQHFDDLETLRAAELPEGPSYTFVAGEQALTTGLRRHLVNDRKFAKTDITFTGFWRHGHSAH